VTLGLFPEEPAPRKTRRRRVVDTGQGSAAGAAPVRADSQQDQQRNSGAHIPSSAPVGGGGDQATGGGANVPSPVPLVRVVIPGEPNAQGRGRAVRMGKFVRIHPDARDGRWRGRAQVVMQEAMAGRPPLTGDLELRIRGVWECPASLARKTSPRPRGWFQGRKDADNVAKAVQDAGNGVLWIDDRQVVRLVVEKIRGAQGEPPRVEIEVEQLAD